ncbi:DUF928 domain-containing protein [Pedobacter frigiditerrae]|uniref:DUF928 domain-containing protein n=1 Tax=Pedobacter frigiditerrae TaxID=2530452 RepID=A0A4R0MKY6_9SPHI|nr:DUF928 domain-containing protein [Pedobacter frigiditerrae]TCC87291.1 DUF928 domain-containing protein [Pedobacter frigiditerrae]
MISYKRLILVILLFVSVPAFSQVSIQFVPELFGRSIDGLMSASIYSLKDRKSVRLNITVSEAKTGKVLSIQTQPFTIVPGMNLLPPSTVKTAKVTISNTNTGNYIRQHGNFPMGDYDYNYVVMASSSSEEIIIDQNFSQEITPPAPFDLIEPYNEDQICEKRPMFTWQPSLPQVVGSLYQLTLVEMKDKQNAVEALNYNLPIVNQKGILTNLLMYPPVSRDLTAGKKYAWQVTVYKGQAIINRSEVWSFKVDCADTVSAKLEDDNGYRDIEDLSRGNYYVAQGLIKFSLINSYSAQTLQYSIVSLTDPTQKIRRLPKVNLQKGQNKIRLDLSNNFSFNDGHSYVLKAMLPNGSSKSLRFIYKEAQ